jgi:hypothetical protein
MNPTDRSYNLGRQQGQSFANRGVSQMRSIPNPPSNSAHRGSTFTPTSTMHYSAPVTIVTPLVYQQPPAYVAPPSQYTTSCVGSRHVVSGPSYQAPPTTSHVNHHVNVQTAAYGGRVIASNISNFSIYNVYCFALTILPTMLFLVAAANPLLFFPVALIIVPTELVILTAMLAQSRVFCYC